MVWTSIHVVIYVTVRHNFEGQKFTWDGTFIGKWESTTREGEYRDGGPIIIQGVPRRIYRSDVTGDGEFLEPHGIDADSFGNVYVVVTCTWSML